MPPKAKFTRDEIIEAAVSLARESGTSSLTARSLALRLGTTAKPIFGLFSGMDEVKSEVIKKADAIYADFLAKEMQSGVYPPYKASGMGYIRFAREEKQLFKLLFMRDRTHETISDSREEIRPIIDIITKNLGLSEEKAYLFHLEQWIFVHGIASMIATNYLIWDEEYISEAVSRAYNGIKNEYIGGKTDGK